MKFGPQPAADVAGAILAHSLKLPGKTLKKGRVLSEEDQRAIVAAGLEEVIVARLEAGDVHEDAAAARLVAAVQGGGLKASAPFTGRCNLFADAEGLLLLDEAKLAELNFVHEELTIATLPAYAPVSPRQMVATVKVIPFSAAESNVAAWERIAGGESPVLRVAPFQPKSVAYIQTRLTGTRDSVLDKSRRVLDDRLSKLSSRVVSERRCPHRAEPVAESVQAALRDGADIVLVAGASAIVDRRDVVPAGIEQAGGRIEHFGMPVDPGNLLLLARHGDVPVIGLPGCARSPKMSGFDYVLRRLTANLAVTPEAVMHMGAVGLLKEHAGRPAPRARSKPQEMAPARAPRIAAIVLAAGQSRRMGARNKLLEPVDGTPMLLHAVRAAMGSSASPVVVVTGHEEDRVADALAGLDVKIVNNPAYGGGLSTSLGRGLSALPEGADRVDGVLVCLGDMPRVTAAHLDRLIAAFDPVEGRTICVPTHDGKRGNPVLFGNELFAEMMDLKGDVGARHLIGDHEAVVCEVEMADHAVLTDVDSPEALRALAAASGDG